MTPHERIVSILIHLTVLAEGDPDPHAIAALRLLRKGRDLEALQQLRKSASPACATLAAQLAAILDQAAARMAAAQATSHRSAQAN